MEGLHAEVSLSEEARMHMPSVINHIDFFVNGERICLLFLAFTALL